MQQNERHISMPTQEERITTLEQTFAIFRKETASRTREIEENTTIMLGVMRSQGQDIRRIFTHLETIDQRLERMETSLDEHSAHLASFERMETSLDEYSGHLASFDQRFERMETSLERLDQLASKFNEHTSLLTQILERLPRPS
jgi:DNA repair ATPase RecN